MKHNVTWQEVVKLAEHYKAIGETSVYLMGEGPWKFDQNGRWHIRDAKGNSMMCDESYYPWVPDNEADWHLIAAAPELYEALSRLLQDAIDRGTEVPSKKFDAACNALAKARGETP